MMAGVRPSVCRICLDLTRERKGLEVQNWQDGSTSHGKPVNLFRGQKVKGQGHQAD